MNPYSLEPIDGVPQSGGGGQQLTARGQQSADRGPSKPTAGGQQQNEGVYKSSCHSTNLIDNVARLRHMGDQYCDVRLVVGRRTFNCHRLILLLNSDYFKKICYPQNTSLPETVHVTIGDIYPEDFDAALNFIYTGEIQLNVYNVEDFLRLAKVLSLSDLTRVCIEYLKDSLTADNCIRYLRFAKTYDSVGLVEKCQRLTQTEFYRVMSETNMEDLPEEVMVTILQDDKLVVKSELDVCEAMVRWLEKQSKVCRPVSLDPILSCIRWSGVHIEYIRSKLLSNPIMSVIRQEFLSKVVNYHLVGIPFQGLATFHRPSTGLEKCIVTVGLNNGYTIADNMYRIGLQSPNAVSCSDTVALTSTIQVEAYACAYTNMMYVSGLGEKCQEIWRWESVSGWTRCGDLRLGRRKHCAAFTGSTMYVLGGYDDSSERAMNSIEKLEVLTNRCSDSGSTSVAVHSAACVSYRNCIYIFGGADDSEKAVSHVQSFDTVSSECTLLQRTLPRPCGLMRAVMWESIAIIIGGDNCFLFNMDFQRCDEKRGFSTGVSHFGFALENERLYVIGGGREETIAKDKWKWSCTNEVKSVSVADVLKGNSVEWIKHAKLPAATMIHAYAVLSLPVEML